LREFALLATSIKGDRRIVSRQIVNAEIWADPGGTAAPIPCVVRNISTKGAKIALAAETELPDRFFLKVGQVSRHAKVIWRSRTLHVGVSFQEPDAFERLPSPA
jgi:hypothetical protein